MKGTAARSVREADGIIGVEIACVIRHFLLAIFLAIFWVS